MNMIPANLRRWFNPNVLVENSSIYLVLTLFLAMYGPRLAPKLPETIRVLFNNFYFRLAVMFLVVYMSNQSVVSSLAIVVVYTVVMNVLQTQEAFAMREHFEANMRGQRNNGAPVAQCDNYDENRHYPLHSSDSNL